MSSENNITPIQLKPGEIIVVGKKIYGRCAACGATIRVNKPILGGAHVCN